MSRRSDKSWKYNSSESLTEFKIPELGADLLQNLNEFLQTHEEIGSESLDHLLQSLQQASAPETKHKIDIVTWRGVLSKLMLTPYSNDSYCLSVWKHKDCLFLQNRCHSGFPTNEIHQKFCYSGYAFESYCNATDPKFKTPDTNSCYVNIYKTKFENKVLLYGAEVDCYKKTKDEDNDKKEFLELKVCNLLKSKKNIINFEKYKLLKIFIQSYLVNIKNIFIGFRNNNNFKLEKYQNIKTLNIPHLSSKYWNYKISLKFLDLILTFILNKFNNINDDDEDDDEDDNIYELKYDGKRNKIIFNKTKRQKKEIIKQHSLQILK